MTRDELVQQPLFWVALGVGAGYLWANKPRKKMTSSSRDGDGSGTGIESRSNAAGKILETCNSCESVQPMLQQWAEGDIPSPRQLIYVVRQLT